MAGLVGESHNLVFDARAIAGAGGGIWPLYIGARCRLLRMISWMVSLVAPIQQFTWAQRRFPAVLRLRRTTGQEGRYSFRVRKRQRNFIPRLFLKRRKIDRLLFQAAAAFRSSSRPNSKPEACEASRKSGGGGFAHAAAFGLAFAGVHQAAKERAGADDDRAAAKAFLPSDSMTPVTRKGVRA